MTIKEISVFLGVSKTTIQRTIKDTRISCKKIGNRFIVEKEDVKKIIKHICPDDQKILEQRLEKIETNATNESATNDTCEISNDTNKTHNETNEPAIESKETNEEKLINMLEKALEDKENTIRAQQNQIDMLIKSNAALNARITLIEDKKNENNAEPEIISSKASEKKSFWEKLFH